MNHREKSYKAFRFKSQSYNDQTPIPSPVPLFPHQEPQYTPLPHTPAPEWPMIFTLFSLYFGYIQYFNRELTIIIWNCPPTIKPAEKASFDSLFSIAENEDYRSSWGRDSGLAVLDF